MRKINRSLVDVPSVLTGEAVSLAKRRISDFYVQMPDGERKRRRAPLDKEILASIALRSALDDLFRKKCAFCETPVTHYSEVEHYRPIDSANDGGPASQSREGYAWFAYEWRNLLLACASCRSARVSQFPIDGLPAPILCSWEEANEIERPLLIDPCWDDPIDHLQFGLDGEAIGVSERGLITVDLVDLNRPELINARRKSVQAGLEALESFRHGDDGSRGALAHLLTDDSPHSGAVAAFLILLNARLAGHQGLRNPSRALGRLAETSVDLARRSSHDAWNEVLVQYQNRLALTEHIALEPILQARQARSQFSRLRRRTAGSRITRIKIKNFKGVEDLVIEVPSPNQGVRNSSCLMLLGENATGKSSILQAITLCLLGSQQRGRLSVGADEFLSREVGGWQLVGDKTAEVDVEFETGATAALRIDPALNTIVGADEPATVMLAYGPHRIFSDDRRKYRPGAVARSLFHPVAPISSPLEWLEAADSESFDSLARALREVLLLGDGDAIFRDEERRVYVRAYGRETPIARLSEGYRSVLALAVDAMRHMMDVWGNLENARGVVIVDEIESNLHPRWKFRVVDGLRRAMPNVQFIFTTHDPLCLRGMEDREVVVLYRDDDQRIQALDDLPDPRGMRAEQLLTSDYFGLNSTADEGTESALEAAAVAVIGTGHQPESRVDERALAALAEVVQIGDSPEQTAAYEALRRFIRERAHASAPVRSELKENAVLAVLKALRAQADVQS